MEQAELDEQAEGSLGDLDENNEFQDSFEQEREKDGEFISMLKTNTRKLVENGKLDEVGFEPPGVGMGAIDSLDLLGLKEKAQTDKAPLLALMEKVRDIAFYLPILKQIQRKQLESDLKIDRIYEQQTCFLTNLDLDQQWVQFQRQMFKHVDEKLGQNEDLLE